MWGEHCTTMAEAQMILGDVNLRTPISSSCRMQLGSTSYLKGRDCFACISSCSLPRAYRRGRISVTAVADGVESAVQEMVGSQNGVLVLPKSVNDAWNPESAILFKETFTIRCYEVGANRKASIEAIANLMQEVACNQVKNLGFSTDGFATTLSMRKHHLIWVTTRMHIEMIEYPEWGDCVELQTWFQENKNGTRRDWVIKDDKTGKIIGRATSTWVMMNQDTRRLARVNDEVRAECIACSLNPPRWAFGENHVVYAKKSLPRLKTRQQQITGLRPRRADLDMNQHVNNVTYVGWMMEGLPAEVVKSHELHSISLEFKRECKNDDCVDTSVEEEQVASGSNDQRQFLHMLTLAGGNMEINRGRTQWRRRT